MDITIFYSCGHESEFYGSYGYDSEDLDNIDEIEEQLDAEREGLV